MGQTVQREERLYISGLAPDAERLARTIRSHWSVENRLHWVMGAVFNNDQMRARTKYATHNLALLTYITLNLIRLDPIEPKGGAKREDSSPPPPTPTAPNSSASNDVHAIALARPYGKQVSL